MKIRPLIFLCLLSGCALSPEQIAEQKHLQEQQDFQTCQSYGLRPRTDAFANCRLQLDLARQQRQYYYDNYYDHPHIYGGFYHYR